MLVLSRNETEQIKVGSDIIITVVRIERGRVIIGIDAPKELPIRRIEKRKEAQTAAE